MQGGNRHAGTALGFRGAMLIPTKVRSAAASLLSTAGYVIPCDNRIGTLDDVQKDSLLAFILLQCVCTSEMAESDLSFSR